MAKGTTLYYGTVWKERGEAYQKKFPEFEQYYLANKEEIDKALGVKEQPVSEEKKKKVK